jgi:ABC-type polysaccharide/polyol phosphate export permease
VNPVTYVLEAVRCIMVTGFEPPKVLTAYIVAFAFLGLTSTTALLAFRKISK